MRECLIVVGVWALLGGGCLGGEAGVVRDDAGDVGAGQDPGGSGSGALDAAGRDHVNPWADVGPATTGMSALCRSYCNKTLTCLGEICPSDTFVDGALEGCTESCTADPPDERFLTDYLDAPCHQINDALCHNAPEIEASCDCVKPARGTACGLGTVADRVWMGKEFGCEECPVLYLVLQPDGTFLRRGFGEAEEPYGAWDICEDGSYVASCTASHAGTLFTKSCHDDVPKAADFVVTDSQLVLGELVYVPAEIGIDEAFEGCDFDLGCP